MRNYHGMTEYSETYLETTAMRPPVLKDHNFFAEGPAFQYN